MAVRKAPVPKKGAGAKTRASRSRSRSPVPPRLTNAPRLVSGAVADLPKVARASSDSRTARYARQMAEVRRLVKIRKIKRGAWVPIAEFASPRGAAEVRRALTRGLRPVDGQLADWGIEARRAEGSDTGRGSVLWVSLLP